LGLKILPFSDFGTDQDRTGNNPIIFIWDPEVTIHMRSLTAFTIISLDGFFAGPNGEIDWFKTNDDEDNAFAREHASPSSTLLFGRTTYDLMKRFWPTPFAIQSDPVIAGVMNNAQKIVFSKTLAPEKDGPVWKNVRIVRELIPETVHQLKEETGGDIAILGSGSIVRQLANFGLIDEYGLLVNPVVLGTGKYLFRDVKRMNLKLLETRAFGSGKVFLKYRPAS
jgi:dihydrofolate reductase